MIVGRLEHWKDRMRGRVWRKVFQALEQLSAVSPEGRTPIQGDDIYMVVMNYRTRRPEDDDAILESHRAYVDVQMALAGSERIDWFPADALDVKTPYDAAKDVQFYRRPPAAAPASVDALPGAFVVLWPEDAHMPQLVTARGDREVKKVVVKVRLKLLQ